MLKPLFHVAYRGHEKLVKALLKHPDINVNQTICTGWSPLHAAASNGHLSVIKLLLEHPDINVNHLDSIEKTAFWHAAKGGHVDVLMLWLELPNIHLDLNLNTLVTASLEDRLQVVKLLFEHPKAHFSPERGLERCLSYGKRR